MSSRVLKKLGLHKETDIPTIENTSNSEIDVSDKCRSKKKLNKYNLLNADFQSESDVKEDDDHETTESVNNSEGIREIKDTKRKKKRRKKKSQKQYNNAKSSEDVEDEFERSIREVNELFGNPVDSTVNDNCSNETSQVEEIPVLNIQQRYLNPNNELKRIFGSKVVNTTSEFRKKSRGRSIKPSVIITPKDTWMPITKQGISMKLIEKKNNCSYFTFEHSHNYQNIQKQFLSAVSSSTPDDIVRIINDYPYHVDALIQLSELCKVGEDHAIAAELIERAIYALENAFHPSFGVCRGDCRLNYLRQENRSFYVAVLKHIQFVGQRACYRTALELSKMLLSLNPVEDPLAIVLSIDYYALRAKEFKWLIDFTDTWNQTRHLVKLPNFKYSIALAQWSLNNLEEADKLLKEALTLFPSLLVPLAAKCSLQLNTSISSHSFFTTFAETTETKPLKCLIALYVERCYHVWKDSAVLSWIEKNAKEVLDMVESQDPEISNCQTKRMNWFKPTLPVNIKRHLMIYDLTDILLLAGEGLPNVTLHFDPYPPTNSINLYSVPRRAVVGTSRRNGILASFFQALNPNMHYEGPDENELDDLAEEIGEVNQELRRSLRSIVNSIRDLLTTFDTDGNRRSNSTGEPSREAEATVDGDADDSEISETDDPFFLINFTPISFVSDVFT